MVTFSEFLRARTGSGNVKKFSPEEIARYQDQWGAALQQKSYAVQLQAITDSIQAEQSRLQRAETSEAREASRQRLQQYQAERESIISSGVQQGAITEQGAREVTTRRAEEAQSSIQQYQARKAAVAEIQAETARETGDIKRAGFLETRREKLLRSAGISRQFADGKEILVGGRPEVLEAATVQRAESYVRRVAPLPQAEAKAPTSGLMATVRLSAGAKEPTIFEHGTEALTAEGKPFPSSLFSTLRRPENLREALKVGQARLAKEAQDVFSLTKGLPANEEGQVVVSDVGLYGKIQKEREEFFREEKQFNAFFEAFKKSPYVEEAEVFVSAESKKTYPTIFEKLKAEPYGAFEKQKVFFIGEEVVAKKFLGRGLTSEEKAFGVTQAFAQEHKLSGTALSTFEKFALGKFVPEIFRAKELKEEKAGGIREEPKTFADVLKKVSMKVIPEKLTKPEQLKGINFLQIKEEQAEITAGFFRGLREKPAKAITVGLGAATLATFTGGLPLFLARMGVGAKGITVTKTALGIGGITLAGFEAKRVIEAPPSLKGEIVSTEILPAIAGGWIGSRLTEQAQFARNIKQFERRIQEGEINIQLGKSQKAFRPTKVIVKDLLTLKESPEFVFKERGTLIKLKQESLFESTLEGVKISKQPTEQFFTFKAVPQITTLRGRLTTGEEMFLADIGGVQKITAIRNLAGGGKLIYRGATFKGLQTGKIFFDDTLLQTFKPKVIPTKKQFIVKTTEEPLITTIKDVTKYKKFATRTTQEVYGLKFELAEKPKRGFFTSTQELISEGVLKTKAVSKVKQAYPIEKTLGRLFLGKEGVEVEPLTLSQKDVKFRFVEYAPKLRAARLTREEELIKAFKPAVFEFTQFQRGAGKIKLEGVRQPPLALEKAIIKSKRAQLFLPSLEQPQQELITTQRATRIMTKPKLGLVNVQIPKTSFGGKELVRFFGIEAKIAQQLSIIPLFERKAKAVPRLREEVLQIQIPKAIQVPRLRLRMGIRQVPILRQVPTTIQVPTQIQVPAPIQVPLQIQMPAQIQVPEVPVFPRVPELFIPPTTIFLPSFGFGELQPRRRGGRRARRGYKRSRTLVDIENLAGGYGLPRATGFETIREIKLIKALSFNVLGGVKRRRKQ